MNEGSSTELSGIGILDSAPSKLPPSTIQIPITLDRVDPFASTRATDDQKKVQSQKEAENKEPTEKPISPERNEEIDDICNRMSGFEDRVDVLATSQVSTPIAEETTIYAEWKKVEGILNQIQTQIKQTQKEIDENKFPTTASEGEGIQGQVARLEYSLFPKYRAKVNKEVMARLESELKKAKHRAISLGESKAKAIYEEYKGEDPKAPEVLADKWIANIEFIAAGGMVTIAQEREYHIPLSLDKIDISLSRIASNRAELDVVNLIGDVTGNEVVEPSGDVVSKKNVNMIKYFADQARSNIRTGEMPVKYIAREATENIAQYIKNLVGGGGSVEKIKRIEGVVLSEMTKALRSEDQLNDLSEFATVPTEDQIDRVQDFRRKVIPFLTSRDEQMAKSLERQVSTQIENMERRLLGYQQKCAQIDTAVVTHMADEGTIKKVFRSGKLMSQTAQVDAFGSAQKASVRGQIETLPDISFFIDGVDAEHGDLALMLPYINAVQGKTFFEKGNSFGNGGPNELHVYNSNYDVGSNVTPGVVISVDDMVFACPETKAEEWRSFLLKSIKEGGAGKNDDWVTAHLRSYKEKPEEVFEEIRKKVSSDPQAKLMVTDKTEIETGSRTAVQLFKYDNPEQTSKVEEDVSVQSTKYETINVDRIREIINQDNFIPQDLINELSKDPHLSILFSSDAGVREHFSIERHTLMGLSQFEYYIPVTQLPSIIDRQLFRISYALHDIGKPESVKQTGNGKEQHRYTTPIVQEVLKECGFGEDQIKIAAGLINQDYIGSLLKGEWDVQKSADSIILRASELGVSVSDYYQAVKIFYMVDASSYTKDAGSDGMNKIEQVFTIDRENHRLSFSQQSSNSIDKLEKALGIVKS